MEELIRSGFIIERCMRISFERLSSSEEERIFCECHTCLGRHMGRTLFENFAGLWGLVKMIVFSITCYSCFPAECTSQSHDLHRTFPWGWFPHWAELQLLTNDIKRRWPEEKIFSSSQTRQLCRLTLWMYDSWEILLQSIRREFIFNIHKEGGTTRLSR